MRIARSTGVLSGLLVALLGIWAGIIPFVGPYFDYSFGSNATWHYTSDRLWLSILPAAAAILGGMLMIAAATRVAGWIGGWLAMAAGGWLIVGPAVSRLWEHAEGPIGRPLYGNVRQMAELVGYFYGAGALILALAAFAVGRFLSRPRLAAEAIPVGAAGTAARRERSIEREPPLREPVVAERTVGEQPAAGVPLAEGQAEASRRAPRTEEGRRRRRLSLRERSYRR